MWEKNDCGCGGEWGDADNNNFVILLFFLTSAQQCGYLACWAGCHVPLTLHSHMSTALACTTHPPPIHLLHTCEIINNPRPLPSPTTVSSSLGSLLLMWLGGGWGKILQINYVPWKKLFWRELKICFNLYFAECKKDRRDLCRVQREVLEVRRVLQQLAAGPGDPRQLVCQMWRCCGWSYKLWKM